MQQQFETLCSAFMAGPVEGAQAWEGLQELSRRGFGPARMFVATQKLKSPAPLHDPARAIDMLAGLAQSGSGTRPQQRAMALYLRGEALICHTENRLDEGFRELQAAATLGHAEAQLSVAYCLRRGIGTETDQNASVAWLGKAAVQGHPRAMFELGMGLAQAPGGDDDIRQAQQMLQRAASYNYPASGAMADQLQRHQRLKPRLQSRQVLHANPQIEKIDGTLDVMECSHLAAAAMPHLQASRVITDDHGGALDAARTSQGMNFHHGLRDVVVTSVIRRLCGIAGCTFSQTEALTVLMYLPGAEYKVHPDFFPPGSEASQRLLANGGQRVKTAICYLNRVGAGGETAFPDLGIQVQPEPGSVLYFQNADEDGKPYPESRHAGLPVQEGIKWISTLWIRQSDHDQWSTEDRRRDPS